MTETGSGLVLTRLSLVIEADVQFKFTQMIAAFFSNCWRAVCISKGFPEVVTFELRTEKINRI